MITFCAKLKQRERNKYRMILSTDTHIYSTEDISINSSTPYGPGTLVEPGEWFYVQEAATQSYAIDLIKNEYGSVEFNTMEKNEFGTVDFIFMEINNLICFQNVSKARLISKKCISFGRDNFEYNDDQCEIVINPIPDAIYNKEIDVLYFKRLESITSIFKGIDQLYKDATSEEVTEFLSSDFIELKDGYNASDVKTANRKRIALAKITLERLDQDSRQNIFTYIGEYCPNLKKTETSFEIANEEDLKMLLYGIEQRFYTTIVGEEKRIANSVVLLG